MDINVTKDSSLLLHAIYSPFYRQIFQKTKLFTGFQDPYQKSAKQENSRLFMNGILWNGKMRVENQTKLAFEETKNAVLEFHLRGGIGHVVFDLLNVRGGWSMKTKF